MYCLFNGEYGEHDLSNVVTNIDKIIERQNMSYSSKEGVIVGDFVCEKVEYDWGRRDQRWTCRCINCGTIIYQYKTKDWVRGHGRSVRCRVCIERRKEEEKRIRSENAKKRKENARKAREEAEERKKRSKRKLYTDPKWVGYRNGHAVTIKKDEERFLLRCDCGREFYKYPYSIFVRKNVVDCGDDFCPYCIKRKMEQQEPSHISIGYDFEDYCEEMLSKGGYVVEHVGKTGDFGVDLIACSSDGTEIAIQCKKNNAPMEVKAIQEVYAGGRYYGKEHFAVISPSGFTKMSCDMASVLGVYLCKDVKKFAYSENKKENAREMLPLYEEAMYSRCKLYEIKGEKKPMAEWCKEYGMSSTLVYKRMQNGYSFEDAILGNFKRRSGKQYTVRGFTGSITEIGEHFGILPQTIQYRMKYRGMALEEAVFAEKYPCPKKISAEQKGTTCREAG